jgi:hypothetical protein
MSTKPRLSPPDAARRRFYVMQALIISAFAVSVVLAARFIEPGADSPLNWALAGFPLVFLAGWAWEFFRMVRSDDEMMRAAHFRIAAFSGVIVVLGATMWGILERLLGMPDFPVFLLLPCFALAQGIVSVTIARQE